MEQQPSATISAIENAISRAYHSGRSGALIRRLQAKRAAAMGAHQEAAEYLADARYIHRYGHAAWVRSLVPA